MIGYRNGKEFQTPAGSTNGGSIPLPAPTTLPIRAHRGATRVQTRQALRLLIKKIDDDGRLSLVPQFLDTAWDIQVVDTDDLAAFDHALAHADAMISMSWKWDLPSASHLKLLQLPGAGIDEIDFARVPPGTAICNCYGHEIGIAEYVLGAMLEWTVAVRSMDLRFRQGSWAGSYLCGPRHGELFGKTLGIVGYGRIGREIARRAKPFGMRILACTRSPRLNPEFADRIDGMERFRELLAEADFIAVTPPLNEQTRGLFDQRAFAAMRRTAVIINVARGAIVDETALYHALAERRIGGAIIDVWYQYPAQGQPQGPRPSALPFQELDNVLMTPHASAWTDGLLPRRNRAVAMNLNRLARGETLLDVVRAPA
jgi:phosphoglycerate dehydrogenase-like enzyme